MRTSARERKVFDLIKQGMPDNTITLLTGYSRAVIQAMRKDLEQAQANAKPDDSYAPLAERVKAIEEWMTTIEARLAKLESGSSTDPGEPEEPADEWPEYKQPTGAHDAYHVGDKITYNGKHYTCVYDGCVWTPDEYPQGWQLVE